MKVDADEKELLKSVERGEWKSAGGGKRERTRYTRYAKATFRKDRRVNIRLSSNDLEAIGRPPRCLVVFPLRFIWMLDVSARDPSRAIAEGSCGEEGQQNEDRRRAS